MSVGIEITNLKRIAMLGGVDFDELIDDIVTAIRSKECMSQELMMLKLDMLYGDYFPKQLDVAMVEALDQNFTAVVNKIKSMIENDRLFLGGRFDYRVSNHSNHGLLFTKNW